jgi:cytochrome c oxidase subunit III
LATTLQPPFVREDKKQSRPQSGDLASVKDPQSDPARTGIWVALAAIAMSFAALTSALYVREGSGSDWHHLALPPILWVNTLALIASSITLEFARRRVSAYMRHQETDRSRPMLWLELTLLLGLVFVVGQYLAWLNLRAQGLFLPTNPNSSFFYLLTGVHVMHVLGGLGGLARVIVRFLSSTRPLRRSTLDATSYYWHFMGILWIYLLCILSWKL